MLSGTCLNVDALIEGFDCRLLVDTGSPVNILSEPFFSRKFLIGTNYSQKRKLLYIQLTVPS
jgi:hypothetical protein